MYNHDKEREELSRQSLVAQAAPDTLVDLFVIMARPSGRVDAGGLRSVCDSRGARVASARCSGG